jgi:hypothetical protein
VLDDERIKAVYMREYSAVTHGLYGEELLENLIRKAIS